MTHIRSTTPRLFAVLTLAITLVAPAAQAVTVTVGTASGAGGGQVTVPVTIDNSTGLLALQFRVTFDPAVFTATNASTGSITNGFSIASNVSGGALNVAMAGGSPAPAGGGTVAVLTFTAKLPCTNGSKPLAITSVLVNDVPVAGQNGAISLSGCGGDPSPTWVRTWMIPSTARVQGAGAFWKTDLTIRNGETSTATVLVKFLGHDGAGAQGPERTLLVLPGETQSFADVLMSLFGQESDYGPILVRSTLRGLNVVTQTWTAGGGGSYGQSVAGTDVQELVGATSRSIAAIRQDSAFRTNLMLANALASTATVDVALVSSTGLILGSKSIQIGPYSRAQLNVANDFGQSALYNAAFVITSTTPGAAISAYASVIDNVTGDPRTLTPQ